MTSHENPPTGEGHANPTITLQGIRQVDMISTPGLPFRFDRTARYTRQEVSAPGVGNPINYALMDNRNDPRSFTWNHSTGQATLADAVHNVLPIPDDKVYLVEIFLRIARTIPLEFKDKDGNVLFNLELTWSRHRFGANNFEYWFWLDNRIPVGPPPPPPPKPKGPSRRRHYAYDNTEGINGYYFEDWSHVRKPVSARKNPKITRIPRP